MEMVRASKRGISFLGLLAMTMSLEVLELKVEASTEGSPVPAWMPGPYDVATVTMDFSLDDSGAIQSTSMGRKLMSVMTERGPIGWVRRSLRSSSASGRGLHSETQDMGRTTGLGESPVTESPATDAGNVSAGSAINNIKIRVTYPKAAANSTIQSTSKLQMPVLLFYSGFQARASWYSPTMKDMASWGYVCVQYDLPAFSIVSDAEEVKLFDPIVTWIQQGGLSALIHGKTAGVVNGTRLVVGGHSRGGKLAALVFAEHDTVVAAWLIDPINESEFAPVSPDYPDAAGALKKSGKKIGVAGADIQSSCNPKVGNYEVFFAAGAMGSWKVVVNGTSHTTFLDAGQALNMIQDGLCGKGSASRQYVADTMATFMLNWFYTNFESITSKDELDTLIPSTDPSQQFTAWVRMEEKAGTLTFQVKK